MKSISMECFVNNMLKRLVLIAACTLFLLPATVFAAADWEWSQDKGWSQTTGRALPNPSEQLKVCI